MRQLMKIVVSVRRNSNNSSSSTLVTVDESSKKSLKSSLTLTKEHSSKKVQFDDAALLVQETQPMHVEELDQLFYTALDYQSNKSCSVDTARLLESSDRSLRRVLIRVYTGCSDAAYEQSSSLISAEEMEVLVMAMETGLVIGLEKTLVGRIVKDRMRRRAEMIDLVLDLQDCPLSVDEKSQLIRRGCENLSRPCRLFAEALGQAHAVNLDKVDSNSQRL